MARGAGPGKAGLSLRGQSHSRGLSADRAHEPLELPRFGA
jgi:hypothetical protein